MENNQATQEKIKKQQAKKLLKKFSNYKKAKYSEHKNKQIKVDLLDLDNNYDEELKQNQNESDKKQNLIELLQDD